MPEFVACPACGCRVQMSESMIGRSVRCISCNHRFIASSPTEAETRRVEPLAPHQTLPVVDRGPPGRAVPPPLPPGFDDPTPQFRSPADELDDDRPPAGADLPCCPACGRRIPWEALRCGHCGVELAMDPGYRRFRRRAGQVRRDCEPHRGAMLSAMGNITLAAGGLTLCLLGLPLLVTLPLGITTWVMATADLGKMRNGEMEAQGRFPTESARTSAITGMVLSLFFAAGWGLLGLSRVLS
jgi:hypothetical protein